MLDRTIHNGSQALNMVQFNSFNNFFVLRQNSFYKIKIKYRLKRVRFEQPILRKLNPKSRNGMSTEWM